MKKLILIAIALVAAVAEFLLVKTLPIDSFKRDTSLADSVDGGSATCYVRRA